MAIAIVTVYSTTYILLFSTILKYNTIGPIVFFKLDIMYRYMFCLL